MDDSDAEGLSEFSEGSDCEDSASSPAQQAENFYWQGKAARDEGRPIEACNFFAQTVELAASSHPVIANAAQWKAKALKRIIKTSLKWEIHRKDLLKGELEMLFELKPLLSAAYFDKSVLNVFSTALLSVKGAVDVSVEGRADEKKPIDSPGLEADSKVYSNSPSSNSPNSLSSNSTDAPSSNSTDAPSSNSTNAQVIVQLIRRLAASCDSALWLRVETKYLLCLREQGEWKQVSHLLPHLLSQIQQQTNVPIELHALELEMWCSLSRWDRVFAKYWQLTGTANSCSTTTTTTNCAVAVHPLCQGVIQSVGGQLHFHLGAYTEAMADFWEAVRCFDSAGAVSKRNSMVNALVVAHILAASQATADERQVDPFASPEIAVHKNDAGVGFGVRLLELWNSIGIKEAERIPKNGACAGADGEMNQQPQSHSFDAKQVEFINVQCLSPISCQLPRSNDEFIVKCMPLMEKVFFERKLLKVLLTLEPGLHSLSLSRLATSVNAPCIGDWWWLRERISCLSHAVELEFCGEEQVERAKVAPSSSSFAYNRFNAALERLVQAVVVRTMGNELVEPKRKGREYAEWW
jgi:hypothetical protein